MGEQFEAKFKSLKGDIWAGKDVITTPQLMGLLIVYGWVLWLESVIVLSKKK